MRRVEGKVVELRCGSCRSKFPHVIFSGDTDMVTAGLGSLTSCKDRKVVIAEMTADEWNGGDQRLDWFARRMSEGRPRRLRPIRLLRAETGQPKASSFFAFRLSYRAPRLIFSCACCANGEAVVIGRLPGRRVTATGDLNFVAV